MDSRTTLGFGPGSEQDDDDDVPRRIGRFRVEGVLGQGGMGVVVAAEDPELGRRVAIKLLRRGIDARGRLRREAQALAKVSHPHVIQIFDVGTHEERLYIAMELVEGGTLRTWAKQSERSWSEVRDMFVKAGRGLAAAHAAGLVHRDFKPDNVLVGDDGRVRVADFGLALERGALSSDLITSGSSELGEEVEASSSSSVPRMTRSGTVMGTPGYMAAEQSLGREVDARTDQFAFCVSLYEILAGHRPFRADTREKLVAKVVREDAEPFPEGVPAWLRRVMERGWKADPSLRYPSMDALLEELAFEPGRRRRWWLGGIALGLVVAGGTWAAMRSRSGPAPCAEAGAGLDEIWNESRSAEVLRVVAATEAGYAEETWERVGRGLDAYAEAWRASRREACEATRIRREQSEEVMELQLACLDRRREALGAMLEVAQRADAALVARLPLMVERLPPVEECEDEEALRRRASDDMAPERRQEHDALRSELARAKALFDAARYDELESLAEPLGERLDAGGWRRMRVELDHRRAMTLMMRGDNESAEPVMAQAYFEAARIGYGDYAFRCALDLSAILRDMEGRLDEVEPQLRRAEAEWERAGRDPRGRELLLNARSVLEIRRADFAAARRYGEEAIAQARSIGRDHGPNFADLLANLGSISGQEGRFEEAERYIREALEIRERTQGLHHPDAARDLHNLGAAIASRGDEVRAEELFERALESKRAAFGERHPDVAYTLLALGSVARARGRYRAAETRYREGLEILVEARGPTHPDVFYPRASLGDLYLLTGKVEEAEQEVRRAIEIVETALGPENAQLRELLVLRGRARLRLGRAGEALEDFERSRAIGLATGSEPDPVLRFWLARAEVESGGDPAAGRQAVLTIRDELEGDDSRGAKELRRRIRRWLQQHPEPE